MQNTMSEFESPDEVKRPAFGEALREQICLGKYTRWAADLTEPEPMAVLWAVGEYGMRAEKGILECLDQYQAEIYEAGCFFPRARVGLDVLMRIVAGKRFTLDEVKQQVRNAVEQWRSQAG